MRKFLGFLLLALPAVHLAAVSFEPAVSTPAGANPRGVAMADLFADGNREVLVANFGSAAAIGQQPVSPTCTIQIFGRGDAGLKLLQTLAAGSSPRALAVADLNHDGRADILATLYGENKLAVYYQNADHSFAQAVKVDTGAQPVGLAVKQVGGALLVAVSNYGANTVSLFQASANGDLKPVDGSPFDTHSAGATDVAFVQVGGKPFLVTANFSGNNLTLLPIPGTSSAADSWKLVAIPGGTAPSKLAVADLDQDGKEDLAVAMFGTTPTAKGPVGQAALLMQAFDGFSAAPVLVPLNGAGPNGISTGVLGGKPAVFVADRDADLVDVLQAGAAGSWAVGSPLSVSPNAGGPRESFQGPVDLAYGDLGSGHWAVVSSYNRSQGLVEEIPVDGSVDLQAAGVSSPSKANFTMPDGKALIAFPNPAQDSVSVAFALGQAAKVVINLVDLDGQVLARQALGQLPAGVQMSSLNLEPYASGIYSIVLMVDEGFGPAPKATFKLAIRK